MSKRLLLLAWLAVACRIPPEAPPRPDPKPRPEKAALPAGFSVVGRPVEVDAFLEPAAMWRFVVSRLTTLRVEARAEGRDILVSFEEDALHATDRGGRRRTWRLPEGLVLLDVPAHLQLRADLTVGAFAEDGPEVQRAPEVTVVRARVRGGAGNVEEFRLIVKGGRTFRSISTAR